MNLMTTCAGLLLAAATTLSHAAPTTITLPPETATLRVSTLPGYAIAMQKCAICHSADYIQYQPPAMSLAQWTGEAGKMQHAYGAPISDDEVKLVGAYLAVAYGSAKADDLAPELRGVAAAPAAPAAVDVKKLLDTNACLGCHSVDKKIVGPAYHDVAAKYHADADALAKVQASIRDGGSGRWGTVPMPPFAQLKPEELKALAEFVLKQ